MPRSRRHDENLSSDSEPSVSAADADGLIVIEATVEMMRGEDLLSLGGWDVRCAKVLVTAACDDRGLALVDTNGDGRMIEFTQYWCDDAGRWQEGASSGPEPSYEGFQAQGEMPPGGGYRYAYGRAAAHDQVSLVLAGREIGVQATEAGWWAVVIRAGG